MSGVASWQTSTLNLTAISASPSFQNVLSQSINTRGVSLYVYVSCGWYREGGSYQSILRQAVTLDGTQSASLPDLGALTNGQQTSARFNGGGVFLFQGVTPGVHTITYSVATIGWNYSSQYADQFSTDANHCRMIVTSM